MLLSFPELSAAQPKADRRGTQGSQFVTETSNVADIARRPIDCRRGARDRDRRHLLSGRGPEGTRRPVVPGGVGIEITESASAARPPGPRSTGGRRGWARELRLGRRPWGQPDRALATALQAARL